MKRYVKYPARVSGAKPQEGRRLRLHFALPSAQNDHLMQSTLTWEGVRFAKTETSLTFEGTLCGGCITSRMGL